MEEGYVLGGKSMGEVSVLKEGEKGLVIGVDRVMRQKTASDSIRHRSVGLSKIIFLVKDHSGTVLVSQKDKAVGIGSEGVKSLVLKRVRFKLEETNLVKLG